MSGRAWGVLSSLAVHAALVLFLVAFLSRERSRPRAPLEVQLLRPLRAAAPGGGASGGGSLSWPGPPRQPAARAERAPGPIPPLRAPSVPAHTLKVEEEVQAAVLPETVPGHVDPGRASGEAGSGLSGDLSDGAPGGSGIGPGGAGTGSHVGSGAGSGRGAGAGLDADVDLAVVRERIARALVYPPAARRRGWEGKVVVAFTLLRDGAVRDVRVVASSGFASLDRSAVAAVLAAAPFPLPGEELEIATPVLFRLD